LFAGKVAKTITRGDPRIGAHAYRDPVAFKPDLCRRVPRCKRLVNVTRDLSSLDFLAELETGLKYSGLGREEIVCSSLHREKLGLDKRVRRAFTFKHAQGCEHVPEASIECLEPVGADLCGSAKFTSQKIDVPPLSGSANGSVLTEHARRFAKSSKSKSVLRTDLDGE
jgi:hypothetical protein